MVNLNIEGLARMFYKDRADKKIRNELAKSCLPYVKLKVNSTCSGNSWDRVDLFSYLNYRLVYFIDHNCGPQIRSFEAVLITYLDLQTKGWIKETLRKQGTHPETVPLDYDSLSDVDIEKDYENKEFINRLRAELTDTKQILVLEEMVETGITNCVELGERLNMSRHEAWSHLRAIRQIAYELFGE